MLVVEPKRDSDGPLDFGLKREPQTRRDSWLGLPLAGEIDLGC
jgi:hypothetical protein